MKQKHFAYAIAAVAVLLVAIALGRTMGLGFGSTVEDASIEVPGEFAGRITTHENGDFTYRFDPEHVEMDRSEGAVYVNDVLVAFLETGISDAEKLALAESVEGTVVGHVQGSVNLLQINVGSCSLDELEEKADELLGSGNVVYASYEVPLPAGGSSFTDTNPWGMRRDPANADSWNGERDPLADQENPYDPVVGDEENPDGLNWWAEAIGSYTAWEHEALFQPVTVGVIDSGVDFEHNELSNVARPASAYPENSPGDHGTAVASIIGAENNEAGLRGVAAGAHGSSTLDVVCADWSPAANDAESPDFISMLGSGEQINLEVVDGLMGTGEFVEIVKSMVEDDGAKAINCSWGFTTPSRAAFESSSAAAALTYADVEAMMDLHREKTASMCIWTMLQLVSNDQDVLIIQAAGNGEDNTGTGAPIDVGQGGYFNSIDEDTFSGCVEGGAWNGLSYEDVDKRILTVGSVNNERDEDGNYLMSPFSNYGAGLDICAPGGGQGAIFAACIGGCKGMWGTSTSAPMATGAAAVLWSIDPELSAPEVREYLIENHRAETYPNDGQEGSYPVLDIGCASDALVEDMGLTSSGDAFEDALEELAQTHGVVHTGTEQFPYSGNGSAMGTLVPAERLEGLLSADIYDYDGDGEDEMAVVRIDTLGGWDLDSSGSWTEADVVVSMFEEQDGDVLIADEKSVRVQGLPDQHPISSFGVFRSDAGGDARLYLEFAGNFNDQWFGTLAFSYDGTFELESGAMCYEHYNYAVLYEPTDESALRNLMSASPLSEAPEGWEQVEEVSWGDSEPTPADSSFDGYRSTYESLLAGMGLVDRSPRSYFIGESLNADRIYWQIEMTPGEHLESVGGESVEELCGVVSTSISSGTRDTMEDGVELTCYDETGMLDAYR